MQGILEVVAEHIAAHWAQSPRAVGTERRGLTWWVWNLCHNHRMSEREEGQAGPCLCPSQEAGWEHAGNVQFSQPE